MSSKNKYDAELIATEMEKTFKGGNNPCLLNALHLNLALERREYYDKLYY